MDMELTMANAAASLRAEPMEPEVFGIRPVTGRPHSINLQPAPRVGTPQPSSRGVDLLVGVGIGAAIMYYLDPDAGAARRARARGAVVEAVAMAPDVFDDAAREVTGGAFGLFAAGTARSSRSPAVLQSEWSPAAKLLAGALGAALTFLGGRRRDALGAAVGVLGSALLARGMSTAQDGGSASGVRRPPPDHDAAPGFDGAVGA